jgi:hypothetical protein
MHPGTDRAHGGLLVSLTVDLAGGYRTRALLNWGRLKSIPEEVQRMASQQAAYLHVQDA